MTLVGLDATSLPGLLLGAIMLVVVLGAGGALVVLVVANRADPDPSGRRPFVVYLLGVAFITLWTALLGSVAAVASLVNLIGSHPRSPQRYSCGTSGRVRCTPVVTLHPIGDAAARGVVFGSLLLLISGAALWFHLRKGLELADADTPGAPGRVARSYVSAVAFVSVLIAVVAAVLAVYALFEIAGPGVFESAGRLPALRQLLDALYVVLAAGAILMTHLRLGPPQLWPWRTSTAPPPGPVTPAGAATPWAGPQAQVPPIPPAS